MSCFTPYHNIISEPKKIAGFSFDQDCDIMEDETTNKVYFNDHILRLKNLNIDLKRNFKRYNHIVEKCKILFRSNMLLHFKNNKLASLKDNMNGAEFFIARGAISALAGAFNDNKKVFFWAVYIEGVIVIANEYDESIKTESDLLANYIGLHFENIVASKDEEKYFNYSRNVHNWEQYKDVNITDLSISNQNKIRVAYSCEIDAFDRKMGKPLELKTKYRASDSKNDLFHYKSATSTFFQCMLGNIQEIVVGIRSGNFIIYDIQKYPTDSLLEYKGVGDTITRCCKQLCNNFENIKAEMNIHDNKGCFKIMGSKNCKELIFTYYPNYPIEMKSLFSKEFCNTFFH